jgi:ABC-2 type transport system ATP-binding protein
MSEIAIRTEQLRRDFGARRAVDDLTLTVPTGIIFGFLGPNGAGKTTTIRLLLGLLEPTRGRAEVLGLDTRSHADGIRAQTGALLEYPGLYERLTAEDNLDFYGRIWRLPRGERRARIRELLEHFGLWERRHEGVGTWSRGMRQKLAVARTLLQRPALIFLDEPTAGLDPLAAAALHTDLLSLTEREGVTVFLTTHNLAEAEALCRRVGVIREGKLLAVGHPDELRIRSTGPHCEIVGRGFTERALEQLRSRPEVGSVALRNGHLRIGLRSDASVAPLVRLLADEGAEVEEVRKDRASLEDVFLALMEKPA